jgi:hypothetical protein
LPSPPTAEAAAARVVVVVVVAAAARAVVVTALRGLPAAIHTTSVVPIFFKENRLLLINICFNCCGGSRASGRADLFESLVMCTGLF